MRKLNSLVKRGLKTVEDGGLLKVLQSEIRHELSNPRFQDVETGSLGDFKLEWDSKESKDIVLRRRFDSGEEVVVSALLQKEPREEVGDTLFPRDALAKVCIKKPGLTPILQFDCQVFETRPKDCVFDIDRAYLIRSPSSTYVEDFYSSRRGSRIISRERAFKEYLVSKGIDDDLSYFILCHLNKKEQDQYVDWLRKLESTVMSHSPKKL